MPKFRPIQTSFAVGEISSQLLGRIDTEVYQQAVAECLNMVPQAQGPIVERRGNLLIGLAKNDNTAIRLIPFNLTRGNDYVLEIGNLYMRIWDINGQVDLRGPERVQDRYFQTALGVFWNDQSTGSKSVQLEPINLRAALISTGPTGDAILHQQFTIDAGDVNAAHTLSFRIAGPNQVRVTLGNPANEQVYLDQNYSAGLHTVAITPTDATVILRAYNSNAGSNTHYFSFPSFRKDGAGFEITTKWSQLQFPDLQFDMVSAADTMIFTHGEVAIARLIRNSHSDWTLEYQDTTPFIVGAPTEWTGTNWPSVVCVFEGRLWLASSPSQRARLNASKAGQYFDFTAPTGTPTDEDPIDVTLATKGTIEWLRGQREFLMGTDLNELVISSSAGVITPTDIDIRPHSAYGSASVQAENIGDQVIYISPDRRKVRAADYSHEKQGWVSMDITWFAQHITANRVRYVDYARDPGNLLTLLMEDGTIVTCTYDRNVQSRGWAKHTMKGSLEAVCVTNGNQGSIIWTALIAENGKVHIAASLPTLAVNRPFLDSAVFRPVIQHADGTYYVDNLDHLQTLEVGILVDGAVREAQTVINDATYGGWHVKLARGGTNAEVGLTYTARFRTVPFDKGAPDGAMTPYLRRWNKVFVRVWDSAKPLINGKRAPERSPATPMNVPQPPMTEDIQVTTTGWDRSAGLTIEQDLPLPLTVLAIFGELNIEGS